MTAAAHLVTQSGFSCPLVRLDSKNDSFTDMNDLVDVVQTLYSGYSLSNTLAVIPNVNVKLIKDTTQWTVVKLRNISWDVSVYNVMEYFDGFKVISVSSND